MQNKLKSQSSQVIQELRTANIKCVMVTGEFFRSNIDILYTHLTLLKKLLFMCVRRFNFNVLNN